MLHSLESLEARRLLAATGAISGSVYTDLNANAKHETGEAGLKKVRVYLDANNNGAWDSRSETSALSDKRGQFQFTGLNAGTYRLREVAAEGYRVVGPRSRWFKITLADGQHVARRQFANAPIVGNNIGSGSGSGTEFGSTDLNGVADFDDYSHTDDGFNNNRTGWYNGDFDYNGIVDFDDYSLIDQAFSGQGVVTLTLPADPLVSAPVPPSIKSIAKADFKLTHDDHSLLSAKSWLSGDKDVIRSSGLQTVIDHYHQYGIDYKRAFLKLAADY